MNEEQKQSMKKGLRLEVFAPAYIVVAAAALIGLLNSDLLTSAMGKYCEWALDSFGWLIQLSMTVTTILALITLFSKVGNMRIGGKDAKPKYSFGTWFAMALTGGIATGIVTWGVNEPLIYYGNVWGELDTLGIPAGTTQAAIFAMARVFYNWSFVPYSAYAMCGLLVGYVYYHKRDSLTVTATLKPLFGEKVGRPACSAVIDTLSMLALTIGLTTGLTMCITLVMAGLKSAYGMQETIPLFIILGVIIIFCFTFSTYVGLDKGLKIVGNFNAWFYYGLLALLLVCPWIRWQGGTRNWRRLVIVAAAFCGALVIYWRAGVTQALPLMSASLSTALLVSMGLLFMEKSVRAWRPSLMACIVHASLALVALGISFSGPYKQEVEMELARGGVARVGQYEVTLLNLYEGRDATFEFIEAELQLASDGKVIGTISPQRRLYDKFPSSAFSEATTYPSLGSEFYVTLLGINGGRAVLRMSSNPLVNWLWIGGALMSLAPFIALGRRRRPENQSAED